MTKTVCVLAQDKSLSKLYLYETHLTLQFKKEKEKENGGMHIRSLLYCLY